MNLHLFSHLANSGRASIAFRIHFFPIAEPIVASNFYPVGSTARLLLQVLSFLASKVSGTDRAGTAKVK